MTHSKLDKASDVPLGGQTARKRIKPLIRAIL